MSPSQMFNEVFERIPTSVLYDSYWEGLNGYLDYIAKCDLGLRVGDIAKTIDNKGRRIIVIGTHLGNVAVFERNPPFDNNDRTECIVSNLPNGVAGFFCGFGGVGKSLTAKGMELLVGDLKGTPNIGSRLAVLKPLFDRVAA